MGKLKSVAWLWIVVAILWIANIVLALAGGIIAIPYMAAITILITMGALIYSIYDTTKFKLGWEAITGFGIFLIAMLLTLVYSYYVTAPLGTFGGAFLWTGSSGTIGGFIVGTVIIIVAAMIRKLSVRKK